MVSDLECPLCRGAVHPGHYRGHIAGCKPTRRRHPDQDKHIILCLQEQLRDAIGVIDAYHKKEEEYKEANDNLMKEHRFTVKCAAVELKEARDNVYAMKWRLNRLRELVEAELGAGLMVSVIGDRIRRALRETADGQSIYKAPSGDEIVVPIPGMIVKRPEKLLEDVKAALSQFSRKKHCWGRGSLDSIGDAAFIRKKEDL